MQYKTLESSNGPTFNASNELHLLLKKLHRKIDERDRLILALESKVERLTEALEVKKSIESRVFDF